MIEVTNRTEGTAKQSIDIQGDLSVTNLLAELTGELGELGELDENYDNQTQQSSKDN